MRSAPKPPSRPGRMGGSWMESLSLSPLWHLLGDAAVNWTHLSMPRRTYTEGCRRGCQDPIDTCGMSALATGDRGQGTRDTTWVARESTRYCVLEGGRSHSRRQGQAPAPNARPVKGPAFDPRPASNDSKTELRCGKRRPDSDANRRELMSEAKTTPY